MTSSGNKVRLRCILAILCPALSAAALASEMAEDFRIKREGVFEFARSPAVTREGDRFTIAFASKAMCDVTVVVEDSQGKIIRHLASGVLGDNAPPPLRKGSREQAIVWDGKDDSGRYADDVSDLRVRVSLGLKPQFERTHFWHPKKLCARRRHPQAVAQPEGVYLYDGGGVEHVKLFSHDGKYIRTLYPFEADKAKQVKGLGWGEFPDGHTAPKHVGWWRATYLPGGTGFTEADWGTAAISFAVRDGRIAIVPWAITKGADNRLARLRTDGTTGGLELLGGPVNTPYPAQSAAFSPDGKWLYLAGSYKNTQAPFQAMPALVKWRHEVYRMEFASGKPPELWLGGEKPGKGDKEFDHPASVCVDAQGRVYVADNHNDRVQVFSPEGELLKSVPVKGPALLQLHHKTQELYVFSWTMSMGHSCAGGKPYPVPAVLRVFETFKSPEPKLATPIPLWNYHEGLITTSASYTDELPYRAVLDSYTDPPTIWMITGAAGHQGRTSVPDENFQRFQIKDGKLVLLDSWNAEVVAAIKKWDPPDLLRQRLHVDPRKGTLYSTAGKTGHVLVRIDPDTGEVGFKELPYSAEDMAIDNEGHILLRCDRLIGRFDLDSMREVPFDYGEDHTAQWDSFSKAGKLISAIVLPGNRPAYWHESGMGVNPRGEVVVSVCNTVPAPDRTKTDAKAIHTVVAEKYTPPIYPGRFRYAEIHIFDKHGKPVGMDIVAQGAMDGHGTLVDPRGDVYFLAGGHRVYDGKTDFWPLTGCVIKFQRGRGRFICAGGYGVPVPLTKERTPDFPPQLSCGTKGRFWVQDAEWIYPGVGFVHPGAPCQCWNSRFAVDYFGRVFVPETVRNQVAVLDTNGNLILHIGKYGNVDDGVPLVPDQRFRTEKPRSLGGDEVALMYTCYVATHSDRRLFIADGGNARILSVKLGYHADEQVPLREVKDAGQVTR